MRPTPLVAAILLLLALPPASAARESGVSLSGPGSVTLDGATKLPLLVTLTLQNVVCTRDVEVPVTLDTTTRGARAVLAQDEIAFRLPSGGALARTWTADVRTHAIVAPRADVGSVLVRASYQLPADCRALGGPTSGETTHAIRIEQASPGSPALPTIDVFEPAQERGAPRTGVQVAIAATALAGFVVLVKRVRSAAR